MLILTLTMRELRHWPSIPGISPQSLCGGEEDGRIGLSSWLHYITMALLALCLLSTLYVINQFLFQLMYICIYISLSLHIYIYKWLYSWLYSWKRIQSNSKRPVNIWCSFFRFYIWSCFFMYQWWTLYFVFLIASHNSFVSVMESLQIPISKMNCVLVTPYRSAFNFL